MKKLVKKIAIVFGLFLLILVALQYPWGFGMNAVAIDGEEKFLQLLKMERPMNQLYL